MSDNEKGMLYTSVPDSLRMLLDIRDDKHVWCVLRSESRPVLWLFRTGAQALVSLSVAMHIDHIVAIDGTIPNSWALADKNSRAIGVLMRRPVLDPGGIHDATPAGLH